MQYNDLDALFRAAKSGDEKTAAELGGKMKNSLSEEKEQMLERALTDKARHIMDELKKKETE